MIISDDQVCQSGMTQYRLLVNCVYLAVKLCHLRTGRHRLWCMHTLATHIGEGYVSEPILKGRH